MNQNHFQPTVTVVDRTAKMRARAGVVLQRLLAERDALEKRLAERGRPDPIKHVTGASALDRAVETTRHILDQTNTVLAEARNDASP